MQLVTKGNDFRIFSPLVLCGTGLTILIRPEIYPGQKVREWRPSGIRAFQHER